MKVNLSKIMPIIQIGLKEGFPKLVIPGGKQPFFVTKDGPKQAYKQAISGPDLIAIVRAVAPDSIPSIQKGEPNTGIIPDDTLGEIPYEIIYQNKIISLTILLEKIEKAGVKKTDIPAQSADIPAKEVKISAQIELTPDNIVEHKDQLVLMISTNSSIIEAATKFFNTMDGFILKIQSDSELKNIVSRFRPIACILDHNSTIFKPTFPILYSLDIAVRRNMFQILVSSQYKSSDPIASFINSVDLVINPNDLKNFDKIAKNEMNMKKELFRPYLQRLKEID